MCDLLIAIRVCWPEKYMNNKIKYNMYIIYVMIKMDKHSMDE